MSRTRMPSSTAVIARSHRYAPRSVRIVLVRHSLGQRCVPWKVSSGRLAAEAADYLIGQFTAEVEVIQAQLLVVAVKARRLLGGEQHWNKAIRRNAALTQEAVVGPADGHRRQHDRVFHRL